MALSETDLELLDCYIDNELSADEAAALSRRLGDDRELADALAQVRFDRDARRQLFSALEPGDPGVARLVASVQRSVNKELVWTKRARALRTVSGIAACLLVGFGGGYLVRGPAGNQPITNSAGIGAPAITASPGNREIVFPPGPAPMIPTGQPLKQGNTGLVGYEVSLTDDAGNVIGVQRFPTLQQARDFANDVTRWRKEHNQLQNGGVRLVGDQF